MKDTDQTALDVPTGRVVIRVNDTVYTAIKEWTTIDLYPAALPPETGFRRATFSGRGPTLFGLNGPLVVAPGDSYIFSAMGEPNSATPTTDFKTALNPLNGTSLATAAIGGLVALYREYLRTKRSTTAPSSYLLRALLAATARPFGAESQFDIGYGHPQLSRLEHVVFLDQQYIGSQEHLTFEFTFNGDLGGQIHVVLSYLDPALSTDAIYPLFADLNLIVNSPNAGNYYGNSVTIGDPFATTEKAIVVSEKVTFRIDVIASKFPIESDRIRFALAVSSDSSQTNIVAKGKSDSCVLSESSASCASGSLKCADDRAGARCDALLTEWKETVEQNVSLTPKQVGFGWLTRALKGNTTYKGIQFKRTGDVQRGIVVCISLSKFKQLADPGLTCTTDLLGRNGSIWDPLFVSVNQTAEELKIWTAVYCVANGDCKFTLSWKSGDEEVLGLSTGAIIGIVVGVVAAIAGAIGAYCCCKKKKGQVEANSGP